MACTAQGVVNEAAKWIGYVEEDSGDTPFSRQWGFPGGAWCGMFVQSCTVAAGGTVGSNGTIPYTHYTPDGAASHVERGTWTLTPQVGDSVYFDWNYAGLGGDIGQIDHIGLVTDVSNWPDSVGTIEGNISNSVVQTTRYNNGQIVGFGRPKYGTLTPPKPKLPWEGYTLANGAKGIKPGAKGVPIGMVQRALAYAGCLSHAQFVKEHEWYGPITREAVRWYQQKQGWTGADADGLIGVDSLKKLGFNILPVGKLGVIRVQDVQPGANNWAIKLIRQRLWVKGYRNQRGPLGNSASQDYVDSYANWQRDLGYQGSDADGHPGKDSLSKLLPDIVVVD